MNFDRILEAEEAHAMTEVNTSLSVVEQLSAQGALKDLLPIMATPTPIDWSDTMFLVELAAHSRPIYRPTSAELQSHALNFLKFYAGSALKELDLINTVKALWAGMKFGEHYLFNDSSFISQDANNMVMPLANVPDPTTARWSFLRISSQLTTTEVSVETIINQATHSITSSDAEKWYLGVKALLTRPSTEDGEQGKDAVIFYLGYLAMVYCRLVTKSPSQVSCKFCKSDYGRIKKTMDGNSHSFN